MKNMKVFLGLLIMSAFLTINSFGLAADPDDLVGSQYIGCGYNIFDKYASPDSVLMAKIFDLSKKKTISYAGKQFSIPQGVEFMPTETAVFEMISGESLTTYLTNLRSKTNISGEYAFVSGSVSVDFEKSTSTTQAYRYIKYYSMIHKYKLQMPLKGSATLRGLLDKDFSEALEKTTDFKDFFDTYGTHFLWNTIVGARVESNYQIKRTNETEKLNITACVKADYDNHFGTKGSASNETTSATDMSTFNKNATKKVNVIGGMATEGMNILKADDYTKWLNAVNKNTNLRICDFDQYSLVPIWELTTNSSRKKTLMDEYKKYAMGKKLAINDPVFKPTNLCISDIKVLKNGTAAVSVPQDYSLIDVDLNKDAKGDFIYLAVKKVMDDTVSKPITGLTAINGEHTAPPAGYTKINIDLNRGAKGDFIYLCYTTNPGTPIRDIKVMLGNNTKADPGYTYVTWWGSTQTADMNKGAGGAFIWVAYTTQIK